MRSAAGLLPKKAWPVLVDQTAVDETALSQPAVTPVSWLEVRLIRLNYFFMLGFKFFSFGLIFGFSFGLNLITCGVTPTL